MKCKLCGVECGMRLYCCQKHANVYYRTRVCGTCGDRTFSVLGICTNCKITNKMRGGLRKREENENTA